MTPDYIGCEYCIGFLILAYHKINAFICLILLLGVFTALFITGVGLSLLKVACKMMVKMIECCLFEAKLQCTRASSKQARFLRAKMARPKILQVPYGNFFYLDKEFVLVYFGNLIGKVVDSVLLFDVI